jgi:hypothetical protein
MKAKQLLRHALGDQAGYVAIFSGVRDPTANRLQYREQCFFECPEDLGDAAAYAQDRSCARLRDVYFSAHALTGERVNSMNHNISSCTELAGYMSRCT